MKKKLFYINILLLRDSITNISVEILILIKQFKRQLKVALMLLPRLQVLLPVVLLCWPSSSPSVLAWYQDFSRASLLLRLQVEPIGNKVKRGWDTENQINVWFFPKYKYKSNHSNFLKGLNNCRLSLAPRHVAKQARIIRVSSQASAREVSFSCERPRGQSRSLQLFGSSKVANKGQHKV